MVAQAGRTCREVNHRAVCEEAVAFVAASGPHLIYGFLLTAQLAAV
jgi:hypothetical protein